MDSVKHHHPRTVMSKGSQVQAYRIRGKRNEIIRNSPASIRFKFWALCMVVVLLMMVYASVYWNMLTESREKDHWKTGPQRQWEQFPKHFDLHREDKVFGHAGNVQDSFLATESTGDSRRTNTIAIGCAVTTKNYQNLSPDNVQYRLPLLRTLIPSFCSTASGGYDYHFYISFDIDDTNLQSAEYLDIIFQHFHKIRDTLCPVSANFSLHFVQCSHSHNPAWAQNDAMMEAYLDDMEYFYRVNDDTLMLSPSWTETFIEALQGFNPPNVGVVGPVHKGGNEFILTYDFVHRTHIDIFGYYYPRLFTDWWADDWITAVYGQERTIKLPGVKLKHTQEAGQRYKVQFDNGELVHYQVAHDRKTLNRYIYSATRPLNATLLPKRVVSMSLWGKDPRYTFGALRNAQLMPVFFPGWTLRVYVEESRGDMPPRYDPPPSRIVRKLEYLGAEIVYVNTDQINIAPMMWRFLAADDMSLDCFIVRDSDARINDRDAAIVNDWLKTDSPFHCVRDHPSHTMYALSGGMWGARPKKLMKVIPIAWKNLMMGYRKTYGQDMAFLGKMVWHKVGSVAYCHDSVSCKTWDGSHPFPVRRRGTEHVGQVFDAFGYARDDDMKIMRDTPPVQECTIPNAKYAEPLEQRVLTDVGEINSGHLKKLEESIEKRVLHDQRKDSLKETFKNENAMERSETTSIRIRNQTFAVSTRSVQQRDGHESETRFGDTEVIKPKIKSVVWIFDTYSCSFCGCFRRLSPAVSVINKNLMEACKSDSKCDMAVNDSINISSQTAFDIAKVYIQNLHKNRFFETVTHFLCSFPSEICQLYVPINKPIVIYITGASLRSQNGTQEWQKRMERIASSTQNVIVAEDLYVAKRVQYATGREPLIITSLCSYTNDASFPSRGTNILVTTIEKQSFFDVFTGYLNDLLNQAHLGIFLQYMERYHSNERVSASSLSGAVYIPDTLTSSTFGDLYKRSIPIFSPSLHVLSRWDAEYRLLNPDLEIIHPSNHNGTDATSVTKADVWLRYLDVYRKPHVIYFESVRDLVRKLSSVNLTDIRQQMSAYNQKEESQASRKWSFVLS